jgi:rhodanese-related sulfurtransferase
VAGLKAGRPLIQHFLQRILMKTAQDLVAAAKARIQEVSLDHAEQAIRDADLLIDVRDADEYAVGHIPGAVHMSRGMLEFKLANAPEFAARDLKIVLYCKTSGRAALAACALHDMGYLKVASIAGGIDGWVEAGKPVAKLAMPSFD